MWCPTSQTEIAQIESIQRSFTSKIEEVKELDYWQRLNILNLYSLERRRERFLIIYAWEQIEGLAENILNLKLSERGSRGRIITCPNIPWNIPKLHRSIIHNSPARKMIRLFNSLPAHLRNITGVTKDTFKKHLDKFLKTVPDEPKLMDSKYSRRVAAESNSIINQIAAGSTS